MLNPRTLAARYLRTYGPEYALSAALAALDEAQAFGSATRIATLEAVVATLETEVL
jgi:hypothetical protein